MKHLHLLLLLAALALSTNARAQSLWTSAEADIDIVKKLSVDVGAEWRSTDGLDATDRWTAFASLGYKPLKWLKLSAGYKLIDQHVASRTTRKGNVVDSYWQPRHRFTLSATGKYSFQRLTLSLRERYQYTHHTAQTVAKWDGDDGSAKDDEQVEAKDKHVLRSCLKAEYNIRKCPLTPFGSVELYNSLTSGFSHEKTRYTLGADWKLSRQHALSLFGRYIDSADDDEDTGWVVGLGYTLSL